MTIDNTRDPRGRLLVADDGPVCGAEHQWSGWTCQAKPHGDKERHRYYLDRGGRAEWWEPFGVVVLNRGEDS